MIVDVSTYLAATPAVVTEHLKTSRLLLHISAPLIKFVPCKTTVLPRRWTEGTFWFSLWLLYFIPFGKQAVVVSFPDTTEGFCLRDNGYSTLIKTWDHHITVLPDGDGSLYRDHVKIEAGVLTPLIWAFAQCLYRHRQRRWRQLVANNFENLSNSVR